MGFPTKQTPALCECGEHAWLRLNRGTTLVSPEDIGTISGGRWAVVLDKRRGALTGYARHRTRGRLHRLIAKAQHGQFVDHKNHDLLDNRRDNLRLCTPAQSVRNRRPFRGKKSQYQGVTWYKRTQKWAVRILFEYRRHFIGFFDDELEAARAHDVAAKKLHGEFAYLNFPDEAGVSSR